MASVPPVEAPMAMTLSVVLIRADEEIVVNAVLIIRFGFEVDAALIFSARRFIIFGSSLETSAEGLGKISTAPASIARRLVSHFPSIKELTITMGIG